MANRSRHRIWYPEIDLHKHDQIFNKGVKTIQWKKIVFSTSGSGTFGQQHARNKTKQIKSKQKKSKHRAYIIYKKLNSRWIMDLYIKQKTINFLEDTIGDNLDDPEMVIIFQCKGLIYYKKLTSFPQLFFCCCCSVKETVKKVTR